MKIFPALFLTLLTSLGRAELDSNSDIPRPQFWSMITNIPEDFVLWGKELVAKENLPTMATLLGSTGLLIVTDYQTWQGVALPMRRHPGLRAKMDIIEEWSGGY